MNNINGSGNIAVLNIGVLVDLCLGKFFVDVLPSVWIGTGATKIKGIKVKVTTPSGIVIKDYGTTYDIPTPATAQFQYSIPTQAGDYQYGDYVISVQITDSDNTKYEDTKIVNVCRVGKAGKSGILGAIMKASCSLGKLFVSLGTVPLYQGLVSISSVKALTLYYPTKSGRPNLASVLSSFTVPLFEGVYKLEGNVCALYGNDDHVQYKANYVVNEDHDVKCLIDECAIFEKLAEIHQSLGNACSNAEREAATNATIDALRLYNTAVLGQGCGEDISEYLSDLENLLGCRCTIQTATGTPIMGVNTPAADFNVIGCNVTQSQSGLTKTFTIENYEYIVTVEDNGGALTITPPSANGCSKTQKLNFNLDVVYAQMKARAAANAQEKEWWSSIITVNGKPLTQLITELTKQINDCCSGGATTTCPATLSDVDAVQDLANVVLKWVPKDASAVEVKLDGVTKATIPSATHEYTVAGGSDGIQHTYELFPLCQDGRSGVKAMGTFNHSYCPPIAPPVLNTNSVANAACPYNLNNAITSLPAGTSAEWHNANNTDAASKIAAPTAVTGGTYYLFAKDAKGCYSPSVQLIVTCAAVSVCSAPVGVAVGSVANGFQITHQSALTPPPNNSYTVVRRLTAAPDQAGSYTTVGNTVWDAGLQRWKITDTDPNLQNNTSYTYRVYSNCSASSRPSADSEFNNVIGATCGIVKNLQATIN